MSARPPMSFAQFEALAREMFDSIPPQYREGVDALEVDRATVAHPTLPGVYTLGECKSEAFPTEFGGPGVVLSVVVLYYGSFIALSRIDEEFDWEHEIWETVTHEIQHHLEALAADDTLEDFDYAADQNFARREGEKFDPFFFRSGTPLSTGTWEVDGDVFLEAAPGDRNAVEVEWEGRRHQIRDVDPGADVHFVRLADRAEGTGEVYAVLLRPRGIAGWIAHLLGRPLEVRESDNEALPPNT
jgi:predicted Zn-dependent protease with MMP-like domain